MMIPNGKIKITQTTNQLEILAPVLKLHDIRTCFQWPKRKKMRSMQDKS